jgi:hypothetical protein
MMGDVVVITKYDKNVLGRSVALGQQLRGDELMEDGVIDGE